jgi:vanillate monooxygenase ferredoxin subunit
MLSVKVSAKREMAGNVCSFELVSENGQPLPQFSAGAHIDVHLSGGLVRQYSLCNSPHETHRYVIGVLKDPASRGGSEAFHQLEEGARLQISEPRNHFPLIEGSPHTILLAGGIGITPLLSMVERLLSTGDSFEFHYCVRSRSTCAFTERLSEKRIHSRLFVHPDDDQRLDARALFRSSVASSEIYVCGPPGFIDYVLKAARDAGFDERRLHREYFSNQTTTIDTDDGPFDIEIASTGQRLTVEAHETVLAAFARHNIDIPVSCEQGVCGTCLTKVLEGIPLHRDIFLTDEERLANDQFTPCCSRSLSPLLVLDL